MKALQYLAITAAALVCNPSLLRAQETFDEPVPPPPPSAGAPAASPLPPHFDPLDHLEAVGRTLIKIPRMIHDELRPLDHLKMLFAQGPVPPPEPGVHPVAPAVIKGHAGVAGDFAPFKFGTSARMGRALFVPKEDADPETLANAEEDLNIMMLILEKAVAQRADDDNKKMGIDLFMGGSSSTPRSLLIEGYGAMFMLRTRLALTPPPKSKTENKQKESATSEWDDVRRELYAPNEWEREINKAFKGLPGFGGSLEEYDEQRVEGLKDSVVEALKNAANIRHLKGDNTITVVITGSSSGTATVVRRRSEDKWRELPLPEQRRAAAQVDAELRGEVRSDSSRGSVMLVQAKKSDIDAFAKDNNQDQFKKKVKIRVY